jgi:DNA-binding HxlR family transcriptional regulator
MYSKGTMNTAEVQSIGCVKAATQVLGDKWTPIILRHFVNQRTVRFCQVQDLVEGINPRTLSARLDSLEQAEIISKTATTSESRCEYSLTEKGEALIPILKNMQAWSEKFSATA